MLPSGGPFFQRATTARAGAGDRADVAGADFQAVDFDIAAGPTTGLRCHLAQIHIVAAAHDR